MKMIGAECNSEQGGTGGRRSSPRSFVYPARTIVPEYSLQRCTMVRCPHAIRTAPICRVRKGSGMAKLVFGMNQSLDGYVDHLAFAPSPTLFRHFIEEV